MTVTDRRKLLQWFGASLVAVSLPALGETYPSKPVRLVVPFAAGGASDTFSRIVAPRLGERLGQPVIIDNRPGAGGRIAADHVAKSVPDGYTLLVADVGPNAIVAGFPVKLPYDPLTDLVPISYAFNLPIMLTVNPKVEPSTVAALVAYGKSNPGKLNYASAGPGGISHLAGEMLRVQAGVDIVHIPYKGGGPGILAVVAGEVQMMFISVPTAQQHIRAGKLKAIAMTGRSRSPVFPELPTMAEAGLEKFIADSWGGIMAPAGTPQAIVTRIASEVNQLVREPEMVDKLRAAGFEPVGGSPEEFRSFIVQEIAKWSSVIKLSGARDQ